MEMDVRMAVKQAPENRDPERVCLICAHTREHHAPDPEAPGCEWCDVRGCWCPGDFR
jgi:hypothetical protein